MFIPKKYSDDIVSKFIDVDGSMREIHVYDTSFEDWDNLFYELKKSKYQIRYSDGKDIYEIPEKAEKIFSERDRVHLLEVIGGNVFFITYFYNDEQIEFDFDPREFAEKWQIPTLFEFMSFLANCLDKKVILKLDGLDEITLMEVLPDDDNIYIEDSM